MLVIAVGRYSAHVEILENVDVLERVGYEYFVRRRRQRDGVDALLARRFNQSALPWSAAQSDFATRRHNNEARPLLLLFVLMKHCTPLSAFKRHG